MKNKKGFTLVELLAVIAILAILVIMALPAVLRMFEKARIDSFTNEVNVLVRTTEQQYLLGGGVPQSFNSSSNKLPLTGNSSLEYCVSIDGNGKITELKATNGNYKYESSGIVDEVDSTEVEVAESNYELSGTQTLSYLYSISTSGQSIGDTLTVNNTDVFDNYNDAVTAYGHPYFTAHVVNGSNEITESYVGFVLNGTVYYLKGGDSGAYEQANGATLTTAFGSSNCPGGKNYYSCSAFGLAARAYLNGDVGVSDGNSGCSVDYVGNSYCIDSGYVL